MDSKNQLEETLATLVSEPVLGLALKRPIKALFRNVKFQLNFFKTLANGAANLGKQNYPSLAVNAIESLGVIKLEEMSAEERAWLLIYKAMLRGTGELIEPSIRQIEPDQSAKDAISISLDVVLGEREIILTSDFFHQPHRAAFLSDFQDLIGQWLVGCGMHESRAQTVVERLPYFFLVALHDEWRERATDYALVLAAFETPFIAATENLLEWERYYALLRKQVQEAMFEESFSLSQVYVPIRAYYEEEFEESPKRERATAGEQKKIKMRVVVELRDSLNEWLSRRDHTDPLRVICGGPGSGKSSFAKMWAAELTNDIKVRVLYVPLHRFDLHGTLEEAVGQFVHQGSLLPYNPMDLKKGEKQLLLIFDGLDEIAERSRASAELARNFVNEVVKVLNQRNHYECRIQAVITGRDLSVQNNATHFRKKGQVLHALPYKIQSAEDRQSYHDPHHLLDEDQRDLWWGKYSLATGRTQDKIPGNLSRLDLEEVTSQPLLNYLVAHSYEHGDVDFSQSDINLNTIYEDLLIGVYRRKYEGRGNVYVPDLSEEGFARALEEIALAVWHGNGRTATVEEIRKHCVRSGAIKLLEKFQEGAEQGVTRLLTAFYFREHGEDSAGNRTFEFTHKSFGEYLIAKRIIRALEKIVKEMGRRQAAYDEGWDERKSLLEWVEICGPSSIDRYVFKFLEREFNLQIAKKVHLWQEEICKLINSMLKNGLPLEKVESRLLFKEMLRQSGNAEEALIIVHHFSASITGKKSSFDWADPSDVDYWVVRLQASSLSGKNYYAINCLKYVDIVDFDIEGYYEVHHDFVESHFPTYDFLGDEIDDTEVSENNFNGANLAGTDMRNANLFNVDLRWANLSGADFRGANLEGAIGLPGQD